MWAASGEIDTGEIDTTESLGYDPERIPGTIHCGGSAP